MAGVVRLFVVLDLCSCTAPSVQRSSLCVCHTGVVPLRWYAGARGGADRTRLRRAQHDLRRERGGRRDERGEGDDAGLVPRRRARRRRCHGWPPEQRPRQPLPRLLRAHQSKETSFSPATLRHTYLDYGYEDRRFPFPVHVFGQFWTSFVFSAVELIEGLQIAVLLWDSWSRQFFLIHWLQIPHLLDSLPNIGPLISRWELGKSKNCWNKSFRTSKILTLLYQQFSNLLISQRDMSGPRLGALSNNTWSGVRICVFFFFWIGFWLSRHHYEYVSKEGQSWDRSRWNLQNALPLTKRYWNQPHTCYH